MLVMPAIEPPVAELAHRIDDRKQRLALLRERVLDARGGLGIAQALQDALLLEVA